MPYTSNPMMGKVRRLAVNDVKYGRATQAQAARKYGVTRSAICKWLKRAHKDHRIFIDTLPSRPKSHPNELSPQVIEAIISLRLKLGRCAPIIHAHLKNEGVSVSLSSVGRVLKRYGLTRKKKQARWKVKVERPASDKPGALVQTDTIHIVKRNYSRFFIYTVIDTFTRLAYAQYRPRINPQNSVFAVKKASRYFGFPLQVIQADNGQEFSQYFTSNLGRNGIQVRHSRVGKPNDNAYIERFNRTLQEECFDNRIPNERTISRQLRDYIDHYNQKRLHLSLNCMTPREFVSKVLK